MAPRYDGSATTDEYNEKDDNGTAEAHTLTPQDTLLGNSGGQTPRHYYMTTLVRAGYNTPTLSIECDDPECEQRKGATKVQTMLTMVKVCVGAGVLALPYAFDRAGAPETHLDPP